MARDCRPPRVDDGARCEATPVRSYEGRASMNLRSARPTWLPWSRIRHLAGAAILLGTMTLVPPIGVGTGPEAKRAPDVQGRAEYAPDDLTAPDWVDKSLWRPYVNPPGSPPPPPPRSAPIDLTNVRFTTHQACYPNVLPDDGRYQPSCVNPGYDANGLGWAKHWGFQPGTSAPKYVYVLDSLTQPRAHAWLDYQLNALYVSYTQNPANRPIFLRYYADNPAFGNLTQGPCYTSVQTHPQWIELCDNGPNRSYAVGAYYNDSSAHLIWQQARIQNNITNDYYQNYVILHELGHTIGLAHDSDCQSVMTYCSTVGYQYLGYGANQSTVYVNQYDYHIN